MSVSRQTVLHVIMYAAVRQTCICHIMSAVMSSLIPKFNANRTAQSGSRTAN